jgi:hypothetical protein
MDCLDGLVLGHNRREVRGATDVAQAAIDGTLDPQAWAAE